LKPKLSSWVNRVSRQLNIFKTSNKLFILMSVFIIILLLLLLLADVGKTSFVVVFNPDSGNGEESASNKSSKLERVTSTIGASFVTCRVKVKDKLVRMQVWDTAGQERFKSMAPLYYRKANAAVIMYDVSSHASFQAAKMWINGNAFVRSIFHSRNDLRNQSII